MAFEFKQALVIGTLRDQHEARCSTVNARSDTHIQVLDRECMATLQRDKSMLQGRRVHDYVFQCPHLEEIDYLRFLAFRCALWADLLLTRFCTDRWTLMSTEKSVLARFIAWKPSAGLGRRQHCTSQLKSAKFCRYGSRPVRTMAQVFSHDP